ncbi:MAG: penicillin-binding transpeptidase domain-containing protein [Dysosmobacter welbionis]
MAFAQIAQELGPGTLEKYTEQAGLTGSYSISGLPTAKGSFDFDNITDGQLGWAGVGQYHDQVNPAALMIYMGAIANGGKAAEPYLILQTESALGLPSLPHFTTRTGTLISADTAAALADLMANNVTQTYGASRFPNMDICAKSGTAEVGRARRPTPGSPASSGGGDALRLCGAGGERRRRVLCGGRRGRQGSGCHRQRILIRKREQDERQEKGSAVSDQETDEQRSYRHGIGIRAVPGPAGDGAGAPADLVAVAFGVVGIFNSSPCWRGGARTRRISPTICCGDSWR